MKHRLNMEASEGTHATAAKGAKELTHSLGFGRVLWWVGLTVLCLLHLVTSGLIAAVCAKL